MKKLSLGLFALSLAILVPKAASAETSIDIYAPSVTQTYEWDTRAGETTDQWMDRMYDQSVRIEKNFKDSGLDGTVVTGATNGVGIGNYITPDGRRYDSVDSYLSGDYPIQKPSVRPRTGSKTTTTDTGDSDTAGTKMSYKMRKALEEDDGWGSSTTNKNKTTQNTIANNGKKLTVDGETADNNENTGTGKIENTNSDDYAAYNDQQSRRYAGSDGGGGSNRSGGGSGEGWKITGN